MKANMGALDRVVRLIIGVVIIVIGIKFRSWWGLIGLLPVVTALIGWCGLYQVLGINTCKIKK
ncbi:MAG: DUF2892 domain-containing protein [Candidatus Omnitrophota bacterium]|nr:DUF2892 domain-containing protein [Candidatus Omnitrophota bacterium]MBU1928329.1 DUF2892 domain-containing protein [Candidatus Omnitrophota bacterium]MBU2034355.1 DUF2892 domain-containing protein [Candidatus Omnitrophota bacterium]MBU2221432.1 DUF2892 domain-containing protein [Candidatus Omnitrophota bacterium]MBU2258797.1 DUF2892 domain-containing protein [Candidatus Omnitrophota bacterium]